MTTGWFWILLGFWSLLWFGLGARWASNHCARRLNAMTEEMIDRIKESLKNDEG